MLNRTHFKAFIVACGVLFLSSASIFYKYDLITANWYFRFIAMGIFLFSIRIKLAAETKLERVVYNISFWLCLFNAYDEMFARKPSEPFLPEIISGVVIVTTIAIHLYRNKCRNLKTGKRH